MGVGKDPLPSEQQDVSDLLFESPDVTSSALQHNTADVFVPAYVALHQKVGRSELHHCRSRTLREFVPILRDLSVLCIFTRVYMIWYIKGNPCEHTDGRLHMMKVLPIEITL